MKRWWLRYLLIGLSAYGIALIAKFPAAAAYPWVQGALDPVTASGIEGTVWSGRAADVRYQRRPLGTLAWTLRPLALLSGAFAADVALNGPFGEAQGMMGLRLSGEAFAADLTATLSAAEVAPLLQLQAARPQGRIELALDRLELQGRVPVTAEGEATWRDAQLSLPRPLALGAFAATLSTDAQGVSAVLRDRDSPLVLDAVLALQRDGSYRLSGRLAAKPDAPAAVHDLLRGAGVRQPGAALPLNLSGRLR